MQTRRQIQDRNIRKITKLAGGTSYGITLPIEMIRHLKWRERQKVIARLQDRKIIIEDWTEKD
jgi:antitoxin component of MazEF toxin-antitoxin module